MATELRDLTNFLGLTKVKGDRPLPPTGVNNKNVTDITKDRRVIYEWNTYTRFADSKVLLLKQSRSAIVIGLAIGFLLILMQEFLLIAVVASLMFLKYVLASTQGEQVRHRILNSGVEYAGEFFSWDELKYYFFSGEGGKEILCMDTIDRFPTRLHFNINSGDKDHLQRILEEYMSYLPEAPKMFGDSFYKSISDRISLSNKK
ncbi:hypothetical protein HYV31_02935 [candidate division WWE3 bacterium]|nr:hypothetical protein [candidate division WWE3 bacterium]